MSSQLNEIRSLLSEMIAFAEIDGQIREVEMNFLKMVAHSLKVSETQFQELLDEKAAYVPLKPEAARILQFHRLVLLMNVDQEIDAKEVETIYNYGLKMGLSLEAIEEVLRVMHDYPNKVVPPQVLISIFKKQHN